MNNNDKEKTIPSINAIKESLEMLEDVGRYCLGRCCGNCQYRKGIKNGNISNGYQCSIMTILNLNHTPDSLFFSMR